MKWLTIAVVAALLACSGEPDKPRSLTKAERKAKLDTFASQPPTVLTHHLGEHQFLVLDVPINDNGMAEMQKCFVWRDTQFHASTMACPIPR